MCIVIYFYMVQYPERSQRPFMSFLLLTSSLWGYEPKSQIVHYIVAHNTMMQLGSCDRKTDIPKKQFPSPLVKRIRHMPSNSRAVVSNPNVGKKFSFCNAEYRNQRRINVLRTCRFVFDCRDVIIFFGCKSCPNREQWFTVSTILFVFAKVGNFSAQECNFRHVKSAES